METQDEKHLLFYLNEEFYGIPILKVNEIIGLMNITHVPNTPNFMKGIINLRGKIIPVMDLRIKFSMPEKEYDEQTCIIIVEIPINGLTKFVGVIVDKVSEVVSINSSDVEEPPQFADEADFLIGVGKIKDKIVMLLDIEKIVICKELIKMVEDNK